MLEGLAACPEQPVRRGAGVAKIKAFLSGDEESIGVGDLVISRTIRPNRTQAIQVTLNGDGVPIDKPQAMIDRLKARSFRPMEFLLLKPADQLERLRRIVGMDFREMDAERARLYADRTAVNSAAASLKARADGMPYYQQMPADLLDMADLKDRRAAVLETTKSNGTARRKCEYIIAGVQGAERVLAGARMDIKRLRQMLDDAIKAEAEADVQHKTAIEAAEKARSDMAALIDPTFDEIDAEEVRRAEINKKIRANSARQVAASDAQEKALEASALTAQIKAIDDGKAAAMLAVNFPVAGLGFTAEGVTLNGLPFSQASKAEKMQAAIAIGMSEAPKPAINTWIVEDGALMDPPILKLIGEKAAECGAQVFVEINRTGAGVTIEIEEGEVVS